MFILRVLVMVSTVNFIRFFLIFTLISQLTFGEFKIEGVDVLFYNIQKDGTVSVRESIKFFVLGDYEQQLYKSGFGKNDLSFWATTTGLTYVKLHVNPNVVEITDFRITPQPLKNCGSSACRGELVIDYTASPSYNKTNGVLTFDTGVFKTEIPRPRTVRYTLNPTALSFTANEYGDILLDKYVTFTVELPRNSIVSKLDPGPIDYEQGATTLKWSDMILVRFALIFEVEESISKEVTSFFSNIFLVVENALRGPHGIAIISIVVVLFATYLYLRSVKSKKS